MIKARLSPDQIACILWDIKSLVATGQSVEEACQKLDVSDQNYQRWNREYGELTPVYITCLKALAVADKKGDLAEFISKFLELDQHDKAGRQLNGITFRLSRKIALLTRLNKLAIIKPTKSTSGGEGESWGGGGDQTGISYKRAHEGLIEEFSNIIRFYLARANKNNTPIDGHLVSDLTIDIKGVIGEQVSSGLLSALSNRELSPKQQGELEAGWLVLGDYIDRLARKGA